MFQHVRKQREDEKTRHSSFSVLSIKLASVFYGMLCTDINI